MQMLMFGAVFHYDDIKDGVVILDEPLELKPCIVDVYNDAPEHQYFTITRTILSEGEESDVKYHKIMTEGQADICINYASIGEKITQTGDVSPFVVAGIAAIAAIAGAVFVLRRRSQTL